MGLLDRLLITGGVSGGLAGAAAGDADDADAERAYINMTEDNLDEDGLLIIPTDDSAPVVSEMASQNDLQPEDTENRTNDEPEVEPYIDRPLGQPPADESS